MREDDSSQTCLQMVCLIPWKEIETNPKHRTAYDAEEVYVTGTFDNWSKSEKLEKAASGGLEKEVILPINEKITYKVPSIPFPVTPCPRCHTSVKHRLIHWGSTM